MPNVGPSTVHSLVGIFQMSVPVVVPVQWDPQVNKFEPVSSLGHQMSLSRGGWLCTGVGLHRWGPGPWPCAEGLGSCRVRSNAFWVMGIPDTPENTTFLQIRWRAVITIICFVQVCWLLSIFITMKNQSKNSQTVSLFLYWIKWAKPCIHALDLGTIIQLKIRLTISQNNITAKFALYNYK